jgi:coenzyme F420-dependent glucose-6-phosphate dehydrogenase
MQRLANELPIETCASRWIVSDDPDEVARRVGEYVNMGFGHLVIHGPGPDQERFIRLFQRDVAPRLRKIFSEAAIA